VREPDHFELPLLLLERQRRVGGSLFNLQRFEPLSDQPHILLRRLQLCGECILFGRVALLGENLRNLTVPLFLRQLQPLLEPLDLGECVFQ
jgi:hypothetical protein